MIYKKGDELFPGMWTQLDLYYQVGWKVAQEQWVFVSKKTSIYAEKGLELGAFYTERFLDWSAVYRHQASVYGNQALESGKIYYAQAAEVSSVYYAKAAEVTSVYYQKAADYTGEILKDDRVQNAWKYTQVRPDSFVYRLILLNYFQFWCCRTCTTRLCTPSESALTKHFEKCKFIHRKRNPAVMLLVEVMKKFQYFVFVSFLVYNFSCLIY